MKAKKIKIIKIGLNQREFTIVRFFKTLLIFIKDLLKVLFK